jgi:hypothetical protein
VQDLVLRRLPGEQEEREGEGVARPAQDIEDESDVSALPIRGFSRKRRVRPSLQSPAERQDDTLRALLNRIQEIEQVVEALLKQIYEIKQAVKEQLDQ